MHGSGQSNRCQTDKKYSSSPAEIGLVKVKRIVIIGTAEMRIAFHKARKRTVTVIVIGVDVLAISGKCIGAGFKKNCIANGCRVLDKILQIDSIFLKLLKFILGRIIG